MTTTPANLRITSVDDVFTPPTRAATVITEPATNARQLPEARDNDIERDRNDDGYKEACDLCHGAARVTRAAVHVARCCVTVAQLPRGGYLFCNNPGRAIVTVGRRMGLDINDEAMSLIETANRG